MVIKINLAEIEYPLCKHNTYHGVFLMCAIHGNLFGIFLFLTMMKTQWSVNNIYVYIYSQGFSM